MHKSTEIEPVYLALGGKIRYIRDVLGIDQKELSKRTRLTRTSITNIETGRQRCSLHVLEEISRGLGTTPKGLMKGIWF